MRGRKNETGTCEKKHLILRFVMKLISGPIATYRQTFTVTGWNFIYKRLHLQQDAIDNCCANGLRTTMRQTLPKGAQRFGFNVVNKSGQNLNFSFQLNRC
jgi:hypothetical protein